MNPWSIASITLGVIAGLFLFVALVSDLPFLFLALGSYLPFTVSAFGGLCAIASGHIARGEIKRSTDGQRGRGLPLGGLIVGYVVVSIQVYLAVYAILFIVYWSLTGL